VLEKQVAAAKYWNSTWGVGVLPTPPMFLQSLTLDRPDAKNPLKWNTMDTEGNILNVLSHMWKFKG
jgi:hypothetical protein